MAAAVLPLRYCKKTSPFSSANLIASIRRDDWSGMQSHMDENNDVIGFLTSLIPTSFAAPVSESNTLSTVILHVRDHTRSPLLIAALYGSRTILSNVMASESADDLVSFMTAGNVDSVLHALCLGNALGLQPSEHYVSVFEELRQQLTPAQMQWLIRAENHTGLRPLEFSVLLDMYQLFLAFLSCYVTVTVDDGLVVTETYNLSEYHPLSRNSRMAISPIRLLCEAKAEDVVRMDEADLFNHDVIYSWRRQISMRCAPIMIIAGIFLLLSGIFNCFFVMPSIYKSMYQTLNERHTAFNGSLIIQIPESLNCNLSVYLNHLSTSTFDQQLRNFEFTQYFSFVCYLIDFVAHVAVWIFKKVRWRRFSQFFKQQPKVVTGTLYDVIMTCTLLSSVIYLLNSKSMVYIIHHMQSVLLILDISMCISIVCVLIHVVMMAEMLPSIGGKALQLRSTISVTLGFSALYCSWLVVFGVLFHYATPCTERSLVSQPGILESFYEAFNLSLNIVNFSAKDLQRIQIMHLLFVMLAPISLMNFMISIMTAEITFINDHEKLMTELNRHKVFFVYESQFLLPGICALLRRLSRLIYRCEPNIHINRSIIRK